MSWILDTHTRETADGANTTLAVPRTPRLESSLPLSRLLSFALAAGLVYFSFRGISLGLLWKSLGRTNVLYVVAAVCALLATFATRALRWRVLLTASGPVPFRTTLHATVIGYLANNVLPSRAGEFIRSGMVARECRLSYGFALTTTAAERIVDGAALVLMSSLALMSVNHTPYWLGTACRFTGIASALGIAAVLAANPVRSVTRAIFSCIPISGKVRRLGEALGEHVFAAVMAVRDPRRATRFISLTVVIWLLDIMIALSLAAAFGFSMDVPKTVVFLTALGLASAAPSTPGYVGIYQFVAVTVLMPFGFSRSDALVYVIALQGITYAVLLPWGIFVLYQKAKSGHGISQTLGAMKQAFALLSTRAPLEEVPLPVPANGPEPVTAPASRL